MLILVLLDMYFDAAVVFVTNSSLLFRFAVAILWIWFSCWLDLSFETLSKWDEPEMSDTKRTFQNQLTFTLGIYDNMRFGISNNDKAFNFRGNSEFPSVINIPGIWLPHSHSDRDTIRILKFSKGWLSFVAHGKPCASYLQWFVEQSTFCWFQ